MMNRLDEHFAWLRSVMHSTEELLAERLFDISQQVHRLDEAFHRETWVPYIAGFPTRMLRYEDRGGIPIGSLDELKKAHVIMPRGMYALTLSSNAQVRRFARHPNPRGSAIRRVRAISFDHMKTRISREILSSPNLVSCSHFELNGSVGEREARAFVENPNARNIETLKVDWIRGTKTLKTLGTFRPRGRLALHLCLVELHTPTDVAALLAGDLGNALIEIFDYKSFSPDSVNTLSELEALRGLETLTLCNYMPDDFMLGLCNAPMMETLTTLRTEHLTVPMTSAQWCTFFETCAHWNLANGLIPSTLRVAVSDDDLSWLDALSRWRHLKGVDRLTLSTQTTATQDVVDRLVELGPEHFAHLRLFDIHGMNLLEAFGTQ